jgi:hypothetical protein
MAQPNENSDKNTMPTDRTAGEMDKVIRPAQLQDVVIYRSLRPSGPVRISIPQEIPPYLRQQYDEMCLTPEDEEQIHRAARRIASRFFRERYGDDGDR